MAQALDWAVTGKPDETRLFYGVENETPPASGAAGVIYAGEGNLSIADGGSYSSNFGMQLQSHDQLRGSKGSASHLILSAMRISITSLSKQPCHAATH